MSTDILFVQPSFLRGMGSVGNLRGEVLVNTSRSSDEADLVALRSDWQITGNDLQGAIDSYATQS